MSCNKVLRQRAVTMAEYQVVDVVEAASAASDYGELGVEDVGGPGNNLCHSELNNIYSIAQHNCVLSPPGDTLICNYFIRLEKVMTEEDDDRF